MDRFGNLISNITDKEFLSFIGLHKFRINFAKTQIAKVNRYYSSVKKGKVLSIFGSFRTLELAVAQGSAYNYFGLGKGAKLEIIRLDKYDN